MLMPYLQWCKGAQYTHEIMTAINQTPSQNNAFTTGYGTGGIKLPIVKTKGKRGLDPSVKYGPRPVLRPSEIKARKLKKST